MAGTAGGRYAGSLACRAWPWKLASQIRDELAIQESSGYGVHGVFDSLTVSLVEHEHQLADSLRNDRHGHGDLGLDVEIHGCSR